MDKIKLCVECKHHLYINSARWETDKHWCVRDERHQIDPVTGSLILTGDRRNCRTERAVTNVQVPPKYNFSCTRDAVYFEPKDNAVSSNG